MKRALVLVAAAATSAHAGTTFPNIDPKTPVPVFVKDVVATSTYADKKDAYNAQKVLAYETKDATKRNAPPILWSAWCEGKPDEGIGETVTIHLAEPTALDGVKIAAGVWRTDALFAGNNQPTTLEVSFDGKPPIAVAPKGKAWVTARATGGGKVSTIAIKIVAVKKGKMNDSCISAVDLLRGKDVLPIAFGLDAKAWAALPGNLREIQKALETPGRKGLDKLVSFPFTATEPFASTSGYGDFPPVTTKTWAEMAAACKAYDAKMAKAGDETPYVPPGGCPVAANFDPDDSRPSSLSIDRRTGVATIEFASHKENGLGWDLAWNGTRWLLTDTHEVTYDVVGDIDSPD